MVPPGGCMLCHHCSGNVWRVRDTSITSHGTSGSFWCGNWASMWSCCHKLCTEVLTSRSTNRRTKAIAVETDCLTVPVNSCLEVQHIFNWACDCVNSGLYGSIVPGFWRLYNWLPWQQLVTQSFLSAGWHHSQFFVTKQQYTQQFETETSSWYLYL